MSQATLSRWLRAARRLVPDPRPASKAWTGAEKLRVVAEARALQGSELGAFLRHKGLHDAQVVAWRAAAKAALAEPTKHARGRSTRSADAKRIEELERELRRKDAALAETAALMVLKYTAQAIWGDADDTTDARRGSRLRPRSRTP